MRLQSQRDCRKAVCQQIDEQQMHRCKGNWKRRDRRIQHRKDRSEIAGQ